MPSTELTNAVDGLINTSRVRLWREDSKRGTWQEIPSIWAQLTSSAQWGSGEGGSSRFGSRPVISTGIVSLVVDIRDSVAETAGELKRTIWTYHVSRCACDPYATPRRPCELRHWRTHNTPMEMQAIAANLTDAEQIGWWTDQIRRWISEARAALRLDPPRPRSARDARCPECGANTVDTHQDGEPMKTPALAITWVMAGDPDDYHEDHDYLVRAVECRQCGTAWMRGDPLNALIDQMMAANLAHETMTDDVA